jgi:hypothetical protein
MMFVKTVFALYLAVISLAAPQFQPSEHDGVIVDVDALNNDARPKA